MFLFFVCFGGMFEVLDFFLGGVHPRNLNIE